jgi:hypothetical protein
MTNEQRWSMLAWVHVVSVIPSADSALRLALSPLGVAASTPGRTGLSGGPASQFATGRVLPTHGRERDQPRGRWVCLRDTSIIACLDPGIYPATSALTYGGPVAILFQETTPNEAI